ncbi:hypothetical protein [Burkholderia ubonensis]|uniref:hypothetical protein n=1 Tax=Burkholderia ubonensis TaxID=101571 RepID=UPI000756C8DE|nr:hypothetical protein [Burkholderia ubonensis]KVL70330.1 hypothetical protein WJ49_22725 [Burkholderia ubonensis]KVL73193.1 hypothetical protein WJ48_00420 [Burkholderia ubonensis]KVL91020.1 hypothetical protein WJ50_12855 [Burkholderia ubonensis]
MLNNPEIGFVIMVGVVATIALARLEGGYLRLVAACVTVSAWGGLAWFMVAPTSFTVWGRLAIGGVSLAVGLLAGRRTPAYL